MSLLMVKTAFHVVSAVCFQQTTIKDLSSDPMLWKQAFWPGRALGVIAFSSVMIVELLINV